MTDLKSEIRAFLIAQRHSTVADLSERFSAGYYDVKVALDSLGKGRGKLKMIRTTGHVGEFVRLDK